MSLKTSVIILAAGASSRLGRPKQLLTYKGRSLLWHAIHEACISRADEVLVILGANHDLMVNEIPHDKKIKFILNDHWKEGMASSIKAGIEFIQQISMPDCLILAVCDQPFLDSALFNGLIDKHVKTNKPIVACQYEQTLGTPVLFSKQYFGHLISLKGEQGAKSILRQHENEVATITFPFGHIDIDTNEQYKALLA